ncbi:MAG: type II toxin-antitoxin system PemK/MazF family toxin [Nitrospinae bacterium]|nr:type II toxin-antitoxin system PemK/MazF family toxin [Nitrospinota bacterium]
MRYDTLDPTIGSEIRKTRPVVIVSDTMMNKFLDTIVVCPLTTKLHPRWRSRIQLSCSGENAEIAVDQIRTISKLRLMKKIDKLDNQIASELRKTITSMYGE